MGTPFISFSVPSLDGDGVMAAIGFPFLHTLPASVCYVLEKVFLVRFGSILMFLCSFDFSSSPFIPVRKKSKSQRLNPKTLLGLGKPMSGCCFPVISTGSYWLPVPVLVPFHLRCWEPSEGSELPDPPVPGVSGSPFPTPGSVSLGSAVLAPPGFVPTVVHGKRAWAQRQKVHLRSLRESMKSMLCLKSDPFKHSSSGT